MVDHCDQSCVPATPARSRTHYWSAIAEDERTATFVALFTGFMDIGEPFEEREDADEIRDEHAALLPRALVGMRKLALMREEQKPALRAMHSGKVGRSEPCPCGSGKKVQALLRGSLTPRQRRLPSALTL